jgi:hypothetical protein
MYLVVPPSTENISNTYTPCLSGKSVDTEDESPTSPSSSFGNVTPVNVIVCVETALVTNTFIDAYTLVPESSVGKLVNVSVRFPEVVTVVTLPSANEQATEPVTAPLATTFCPQSLRTSSD